MKSIKTKRSPYHLPPTKVKLPWGGYLKVPSQQHADSLIRELEAASYEDKFPKAKL